MLETTPNPRVMEGDTAVLECIARTDYGRLLVPCRGGTTYKWFRNGVKVVDACPSRMVKEGYLFNYTTGALTIPSVSMSAENDVFTCRVFDGEIVKEIKTTLSVIESMYNAFGLTAPLFAFSAILINLMSGPFDCRIVLFSQK